MAATLACSIPEQGNEYNMNSTTTNLVDAFYMAMIYYTFVSVAVLGADKPPPTRTGLCSSYC
jgi:hypothetical protein